ncbi:phage protein GemA/Gp16 family protein [Fusobacterium sp. THCT1E2]
MVYEKIDKNRIALIHAAKIEVNMTEDNYRIILKNTFNVDTCKDLTISQFNKLMETFKKIRI